MSQKFARLPVLIDGKYQSVATNVSIDFESNAQEVDTLEGFAGLTPGAAKIRITANWAVPKTGLQFKFPNAIARLTDHDIQIPVGADTILVTGTFTQGNLGQGAGSTTESSATLVAKMRELQ